MTASMKTLFAASAMAIYAVSPAAADYTILEDTSLPSVLFIEFADTEPTVITAPEGEAVVEDAGDVVDPALPPAEEVAATPMKSVEERIEERMKELEGAAGSESLPEVPVLGAETVDEAVQEEVAAESTELEEPIVEEIIVEPGSDADLLSDADLR